MSSHAEELPAYEDTTVYTRERRRCVEGEVASEGPGQTCTLVGGQILSSTRQAAWTAFFSLSSHVELLEWRHHSPHGINRGAFPHAIA